MRRPRYSLPCVIAMVVLASSWVVGATAGAPAALEQPQAATSAQPRAVTMQALTLPTDRLPDGCSLKVIEPSRREVIGASAAGRQTIRFVGPTPSLQPVGVTANPWIGTDRNALAWIRGNVDGSGSFRVPDAPPSRTEESMLRSQLADGVDEGYAATYAQAGGQDLGVQAVRFAVMPASRVDLPRKDRENAVRIELGPTWIRLTGDGGTCSKVIEAYLNSLRK